MRIARLWVYIRDVDNVTVTLVHRCLQWSGSRTVRTGKIFIHRIIWPVIAACFRPMVTVVTGRYTNPAEQRKPRVWPIPGEKSTMCMQERRAISL